MNKYKFYLEDMSHKCAIDDSKLRFVSYEYAHGTLERKENTYDYLNEDKKNHFDKRKNINGEECIAVLPSGKEIKALYFHWKVVDSYLHEEWFGKYYTYRVKPRGLVVAKTDKRSIQYAQKCFNERHIDL